MHSFFLFNPQFIECDFHLLNPKLSLLFIESHACFWQIFRPTVDGRSDGRMEWIFSFSFKSPLFLWNTFVFVNTSFLSSYPIAWTFIIKIYSAQTFFHFVWLCEPMFRHQNHISHYIMTQNFLFCEIAVSNFDQKWKTPRKRFQWMIFLFGFVIKSCNGYYNSRRYYLTPANIYLSHLLNYVLNFPLIFFLTS